jgi:hypothetical protein
MATVDSRTGAFHAASRALDHAIDSAVEGRPTHPSGTTFVPADLAASGHVRSYRRLGPVSVVDSDGNETRLPQDHTRELVIAGVLIALVVWAVARRPRALA